MLDHEVVMFYRDKRLISVGFFESDLKARLAICKYILEDRANGNQIYRYEVSKIGGTN